MLCVSLAAGAILLCGVLLVLLMRYQHTSTVRPQDQYLGQIPDFYSTVDADGDGVDDQTDVLDNALAYVETRPKYKSRYYQTGYPDDGYGVCTDVVAFALKNAGYDLQALVDADIREHPQWYDIQQPDANIDFRRVRNLKVFFSHTAVALTTEISETEEWQGGDLVIFENHIGIVSDRRNKNGVPYIIHHNDPWQAAYEQDILEKRTDIVGHYRISEEYAKGGPAALWMQRDGAALRYNNGEETKENSDYSRPAICLMAFMAKVRVRPMATPAIRQG